MTKGRLLYTYSEPSPNEREKVEEFMEYTVFDSDMAFNETVLTDCSTDETTLSWYSILVEQSGDARLVNVDAHNMCIIHGIDWKGVPWSRNIPRKELKRHAFPLVRGNEETLLIIPWMQILNAGEPPFCSDKDIVESISSLFQQGWVLGGEEVLERQLSKVYPPEEG